MSFDKFFHCDVHAHSEFSFSIHICPTHKNKTPIDNDQYQQRLQEMPEVYYFITDMNKWSAMQCEGQCQSSAYNLESLYLYKLNLGRRITLQTYQGFRICFVTRSNKIKIAHYLHHVPYELTSNSWRDRRSIKGEKTKYSTFLDCDNIAVDGGRQVQLLQDPVPVSRFTTCKEQFYFLHVHQIDYQMKKLSVLRTPSQNWIYPRMLEIAHRLDDLREQAIGNGKSGPRILVMGPSNSGKGKMLRTIMNVAQQKGRKLTLLDIDVGQGCIGTPGTVGIGRMVIEFSVEQEAGRERQFEGGRPHVIHYGHNKPDADGELYTLALSCLVQLETEARMLALEQGQADLGVLVNTHGLVHDFGYNSMIQFISKLNIDHIYVHGVPGEHDLHARLFSLLFGVDYSTFQAAQHDPAKLRDLRLQSKQGLTFSALLKPENVVFIATSPFEGITTGRARYFLRQRRVLAAMDGGECVQVWLKHQPVFSFSSNVSETCRSHFVCKAISHVDGKRMLNFVPWESREDIAKLEGRLLSVMALPLQDFLQHCDEHADTHISLPKLLTIRDWIRVEHVHFLSDHSNDYQLQAMVPRNLVDDLNDHQCFLLSYSDNIK